MTALAFADPLILVDNMCDSTAWVGQVLVEAAEPAVAGAAGETAGNDAGLWSPPGGC